MLLEINKTADVQADQSAAWTLIRDVARLSSCIPGVSDLQEVEPDQRYTATVSDKLGPFKLTVPVQIQIQSIDEPRRITAELSGNDAKGAARFRGTLEAVLEPTASGSRLHIGARVDVLGRLAAVGAAPMRRRADQIFTEFISCLSAELSTAAAPASSGREDAPG